MCLAVTQPGNAACRGGGESLGLPVIKEVVQTTTGTRGSLPQPQLLPQGLAVQGQRPCSAPGDDADTGWDAGRPAAAACTAREHGE